MKHSKILLILGIWFTFVPLLGISMGLKKILLVLPGLFLVAMAITAMRKERDDFPHISADQEELIQEIAQDIADDIIVDADTATEQELKKLRDIL